MIRQIQKIGVRQWFGDDFLTLQNEIYEALEGFFEPYGNFILKGCEVINNNITSGLVFIDGRLCPFSGTLGISFPCYLKLTESESNFRLYQDGESKPCTINYIATHSATQPTDSYLTINQTNNRTFRDALEVSGYRFDDRLHITPPLSLQSPDIGDLTIFDDTIYIGKQGDEGNVYRPIVAKNTEKFANKDVSEFITIETAWRLPVFTAGFAGSLKYRLLNGFIYLHGTLYASDVFGDIIFTLPTTMRPASVLTIYPIDYQEERKIIKINENGEVILQNPGTYLSVYINTMLPLDF